MTSADRPDDIPVFLDEQPLTVPRGTAVDQVVRETYPDAAPLLDGDGAYVTDGVGRPIPADTAVSVGGIYRFVRSARRPPSGSPS
jgi:hypothetical protein